MTGAEVREARKKTGLTQQQFADVLGIGREWIGRVERDQENASRLLTWAIRGFEAAQ